MIAYPVLRQGDTWCVSRGAGELIPITQSGRPVEHLGGWRPTCLLAEVGPLNILELRHEDGQTAVWYLNADGSFRTNVLANIPETEGIAFAAAAMPLLRQAWEQLVVAPVPNLAPGVVDIMRLGVPTVRTIVELAKQPAYPAATPVRLDNPADVALLVGDLKFSTSGISQPIVTELFKRDFLRDAIRAASFGRLMLPSPFDGRSLASDIAYPLTSMTIAYKFNDAVRGVTFYAIASLWCSTLVAYYFPAMRLMLFGNLRDLNYLREVIGQPVDRAIFEHVVQFGPELPAYLAAPRRLVTYVYFQQHLGHHLWNELSGLHTMVTELPRETLPDVLMISGTRSEMYGHVDKLLPELVGKVHRMAMTREVMTRWVYANARCLFNPTGEFVSADLARRIIELSDSDPVLNDAKAEATRLKAEGFVIVMLGLRVENRTVVDPAAFFTEVTQILREQCGRVAVVLDGHNSDAEHGGMYPSHAENLASQSPAEVEHAVVNYVREVFGDDPNVVVLSTVGAPVSASVFWCRRSAFFVTPWGAGLAKYRWICNRRGLVVAGQRFFRFAGERNVHLYDLPQYMEAPTPLDFISPDEVTDDPDAPLLIGLTSDPNRVNYRVKPEALRQRLVKLIEEVKNTA